MGRFRFGPEPEKHQGSDDRPGEHGKDAGPKIRFPNGFPRVIEFANEFYQ